MKKLISLFDSKDLDIVIFTISVFCGIYLSKGQFTEASICFGCAMGIAIAQWLFDN